MGILVHLPERPPRRNPVDVAIPAARQADILFFTGVRYVREDDAVTRPRTGASDDAPRPRSRRG